MVVLRELPLAAPSPPMRRGLRSYTLVMEAHRYIPRYTASDYSAWDGDWELWDGVPVSMSPSPGKSHQRFAFELAQQLAEQLRENDACDCEVLQEVDWRVADDTVVRPDVSIECGRPDGEFITTPPALIIEVLSPATADKDRVAKRALYAAHGVTWYLLADPNGRTIECLRLADGGYVPGDEGVMVLHDGCTVELAADGS